VTSQRKGREKGKAKGRKKTLGDKQGRQITRRKKWKLGDFEEGGTGIKRKKRIKGKRTRGMAPALPAKNMRIGT